MISKTIGYNGVHNIFRQTQIMGNFDEYSLVIEQFAMENHHLYNRSIASIESISIRAIMAKC